MVRYSRSSCAPGRRAAAPAAPPRCARASCRSCTASRPPAARSSCAWRSAMRRRSTMGAALRDAHEGLRSLSPRERAGGARDRLRGPPVPGTPAAARRAVAWGLQTCLVFLRGIHAQVTVNSFQSRVPCVAVRGRRSGAEPRARESAHTGTTANSWLYRAEGRGKEREKREGGREGERERGREEERKRGREEERKEERKKEKERGREE